MLMSRRLNISAEVLGSCRVPNHIPLVPLYYPILHPIRTLTHSDVDGKRRT